MFKDNDDMMVIVDQQEPVNRTLIFFLILVIVMLLGIAWLANMLREAEAQSVQSAPSLPDALISGQASGVEQVARETSKRKPAEMAQPAEPIPAHKAAVAEDIEAIAAGQQRQASESEGDGSVAEAKKAAAMQQAMENPAAERNVARSAQSSGDANGGTAQAAAQAARHDEAAPAGQKRKVVAEKSAPDDQQRLTVFYEGRLVKVTREQFEKIKRGEPVELEDVGAQLKTPAAQPLKTQTTAQREESGKSVVISQTRTGGGAQEQRSLSEILARINRLLEQERQLSAQN